MLTLATVVDRLSKLDLFTRPFKGVEKRKNKQTCFSLTRAQMKTAQRTAGTEDLNTHTVHSKWQSVLVKPSTKI